MAALGRDPLGVLLIGTEPVDAVAVSQTDAVGGKVHEEQLARLGVEAQAIQGPAFGTVDGDIATFNHHQLGPDIAFEVGDEGRALKIAVYGEAIKSGPIGIYCGQSVTPLQRIGPVHGDNLIQAVSINIAK